MNTNDPQLNHTISQLGARLPARAMARAQSAHVEAHR